MARKPRTPPPSRRPVHAPKRRHEPRDAAARRRMLTRITIATAATLLVLGAVVAFIALRDGSGDGSAAAALENAGCTLQRFPAQPATHVDQLEENFKYNSEPPSTGPHSGQAPIFDIYTDPVDPLFYIHGLEHGGVLVAYGEDVPQAEIDKIAAWYQDDPNGLIVSPRPEPPLRTIALAAWNAEGPEDEGEGIVAKCPRFNEAAFDAFLDDFGFKGPESDHGDGRGFKREDLRPGG